MIDGGLGSGKDLRGLMRTRFQMRSIYPYRDRKDQRDVQDIPGRDSDEVAILQRWTHDDGKQTAHRGTAGQGER